MAKRAKKQNKKALENKMPENMLPQNILPIGERVEEDKNIYISQAVYKEIHKFTKNKTTNESGGMLIGSVIEEFGKSNIVISGFVEAKYCEATPTTLTFTHETWEYVHKEIDKKHKGKKIVGWIHTHPDFGIFLSEYDKFIHQNFFSEAYQIAYVIDPIQALEGFYFWINGNIEKCKGFYIYDKTGAKITVDVSQEEETAEKAETSRFDLKSILIAILSVAVAFLIFSNISLNNRMEKIEEQQETLAETANRALFEMQQMISTQDAELWNLKNDLNVLNNTAQSDPGVMTEEGDETTAEQTTEEDGASHE